MSNSMNILVGYSFINPTVVVVQEATKIGYYEDEEGNQLGPEYDGMTEAWMNRNDMDCAIFQIRKENFPTVVATYKAFVNAANDSSVSQKEVEKRKTTFLQNVQAV